MRTHKSFSTLRNPRSKIRRNFCLFAAIVALAAVPVRAAGPAYQQLYLIQPDDPAPNDHFGEVVAMSGNVALLASPANDDAGSSSGSAYLFDVSTGLQLHKLTANDAAAEHGFGSGLSIDGNTAVVGARGVDQSPQVRDVGAAYLFDVATGAQIRKLTAEDPARNAYFGVATAIDGNFIAIGSHGANRNFPSAEGTGAAYVFDALTGQQLHKLVAQDATDNDQFGAHIAIDGNNILVGAASDTDLGIAGGSAYLFDAATGQQRHKLLANDGSFGDLFGVAVDISGNLAAVGANHIIDQDQGAVYIFDVATGQQLRKIIANDLPYGAIFGHSVAIDGELLFVGAPFDQTAGSQAGAVYVFNVNTGAQLKKFYSNGIMPSDQFGYAVDAEGDSILAGAPFWSSATDGAKVGAGYVFSIPEPSAAAIMLTVLAAFRCANGLGGPLATASRRRKQYGQRA